MDQPAQQTELKTVNRLEEYKPTTDLSPRRQTLPAMKDIRLAIDLSNKIAAGLSAGKGGRLTKPEEVFLRILKGMELGVPMMEAVEHIKVIDGQTSTSARLKAAIVKRHGGKIIPQKYDAEAVSIYFEREGQPPVTIEWTKQRAREIGLLTKDNYKNYLQSMLVARVLTEGCNLLWPELMAGCGYTPDELGSDEPEIIDVEFIDTTPARFKGSQANSATSTAGMPNGAGQNASQDSEQSKIPEKTEATSPAPQNVRAPATATEKSESASPAAAPVASEGANEPQRVAGGGNSPPVNKAATNHAATVATVPSANKATHQPTKPTEPDAKKPVAPPPQKQPSATERTTVAGEPISKGQSDAIATLVKWARFTESEWRARLAVFGVQKLKELTKAEARDLFQSLCDEYTPFELRSAGLDLDKVRAAGYRLQEPGQNQQSGK